jgi:hypothetical protein
VGANLGHDGGAKGHIGDEVAVHDVDLGATSAARARRRASGAAPYMKPVGALGHGVGTCLAQLSEVGGQDGGRDDGGRRHGGDG